MQIDLFVSFLKYFCFTFNLTIFPNKIHLLDFAHVVSCLSSSDNLISVWCVEKPHYYFSQVCFFFFVSFTQYFSISFFLCRSFFSFFFFMVFHWHTNKYKLTTNVVKAKAPSALNIMHVCNSNRYNAYTHS